MWWARVAFPVLMPAAILGVGVGVGVAVGVATPAAAATCTSPIQPTEVSQPVPWAQKLLAPERAWPLADGTGVRVAVIDSGVDQLHPQLAGKVDRGRDYLYVKGDTGTRDCIGHGTAVGSIIAAQGAAGTGFRGVAPGARIIPLTVSERRDDAKGQSGQAVTAAEFAAAVRDAVAFGAKVINISAVFPGDDPAVRAAVRFAIDSNVVVVAAVGNAAEEGNPTPYPAAYPDVVGVGAIDQTGRRLRTSGRGTFVDLVAPGNEITAAVPGRGHASYTGTSFATPFVAGVAALVRQYRPELSARDVSARLIATASPAAGGADSTGYGHGIVDPYRAVAEEIHASPAPAGAPKAVRQVVDPERAAREKDLRRLTRASLAVGIVVLSLAVLAVIVGLVRGPGRARRWRPGRVDRPPPATAAPEEAPVALFDDLDRVEQTLIDRGR
jgi:type VII secretion-associated serine protease mycosin